MRHHRRAENADGDVQHLVVEHDAARRQESFGDRPEVRPRENDLEQEAQADGRDQRDDEGFEHSNAAMLQREKQQHVESGDEHTGRDRNVKQQIERDRRADDLRQVACGDGDLAQQPEADGDRTRVVIAARLCEVATGDDAELGCESLQQHGHDVRQQHDAEQRIPEPRSTGEIRCPIAGVHVADRDEIPWSGEREQLAEKTPASDRNASIDLLQAWRDTRPPPP